MTPEYLDEKQKLEKELEFYQKLRELVSIRTHLTFMLSILKDPEEILDKKSEKYRKTHEVLKASLPSIILLEQYIEKKIPELRFSGFDHNKFGKNDGMSASLFYDMNLPEAKKYFDQANIDKRIPVQNMQDYAKAKLKYSGILNFIPFVSKRGSLELKVYPDSTDFKRWIRTMQVIQDELKYSYEIELYKDGLTLDKTKALNEIDFDETYFIDYLDEIPKEVNLKTFKSYIGDLNDLNLTVFMRYLYRPFDKGGKFEEIGKKYFLSL